MLEEGMRQSAFASMTATSCFLLGDPHSIGANQHHSARTRQGFVVETTCYDIGWLGGRGNVFAFVKVP